MSNSSNIEWTQATWNPVVGCTRASAGCDNCYAVKMTHRLEAMGQARYAGLTVLNGKGYRHFNGTVRTVPEALEIPLRWRKPRRVFVNSMSDLFHKDVPFYFIDRVFAVMTLCSRHTFQILTKRPERMREYITDWLRRQDGAESPPGTVKPLPNVWLGVSVENQETADERIPILLRTPAAVRFVSYEPAIGPVNFSRIHLGQSDFEPIGEQLAGVRKINFYLNTLRGAPKSGIPGIDWIIIGGESESGARPFDVQWARKVIADCKAAGVACFVKQVGSNVRDSSRGEGQFHFKSAKGGDINEWPKDLRVREWPKERL